jgi:hypothetical protein
MENMDVVHWYVTARAKELRDQRNAFKSLRDECITAVIKNSKTYLRLQRHIFQILRKLINIMFIFSDDGISQVSFDDNS